MKIFKIVFLACCIFASPLSALADNIAIYGVGHTSCGTYIQALHDEDEVTRSAQKLAYLSWIQGYLSAINGETIFMENGSATGHMIGHSTDIKGMLSWIELYCNQHPLNDVWIATHALVDELMSNHSHKAPK